MAASTPTGAERRRRVKKGPFFIKMCSSRRKRRKRRFHAQLDENEGGKEEEERRRVPSPFPAPTSAPLPILLHFSGGMEKKSYYFFFRREMRETMGWVRQFHGFSLSCCCVFPHVRLTTYYESSKSKGWMKIKYKNYFTCMQGPNWNFFKHYMV